MTITKENQDDGALVTVEGALSIYEAAALHQRLLEGFRNDAAEVVLDLSRVDECDTAGVQLLCSARRTATRSGKPLRIHGSSEAVTEAILALGLAVEEILKTG